MEPEGILKACMNRYMTTDASTTAEKMVSDHSISSLMTCGASTADLPAAGLPFFEAGLALIILKYAHTQPATAAARA